MLLSDYLKIGESLEKIGVFDPILDKDNAFFINIQRLKETTTPEFEGSYDRINDFFRKIIKLLDRAEQKSLKDTYFRAAFDIFKFSEVNGICLGFGEKAPGSGFGPKISKMVLETAYDIVKAGIEDPEFFQLLPLFQDNVGPDRLSDMIATLILPDIDTYVDDGYTGTDFDRPEFIRLMDDVRTGKIQAIIVKDLSRFGRNFIETGYYIETIFPCLNVRLISINDEFDSSRAEDRNSMVMPIKNMINEMYAKDASKKRVLSFEMHSQRGDMKIAKSIYGYYVDKEKNQLKVNLETAPIVQAIFRWYQMGKGTGDIVKRLKMLDIMTPFAYKATHEIEMEIPETDRWTGDRIKTILLNQSYIGSTVYGKRKAAKYRNMPEHHTDPSEWIIHENTHEAIVAEPDFEEVQERWEKRSDFMKESFRRGRSRWAGVEDSFPQKVKCMECGTTMTYMRYTNFGQSQGVRKGFYYCKEYDGKPGYCRQKVHEDLLKITVMDQIHHMIKVMCDKKEVLEKMKEGTCEKGELVSLRVKIQNMQYRLMKAEETSATLYENFATGLLDEQEYLALKEHYVQEKEKLTEGINQAQVRKRMVEKSIEEFLEVEKNLEQYLDDRSFNQKLIDELVDKIFVSSKGMIEVRMKCSDVFQKVMEIME